MSNAYESFSFFLFAECLTYTWDFWNQAWEIKQIFTILKSSANLFLSDQTDGGVYSLMVSHVHQLAASCGFNKANNQSLVELTLYHLQGNPVAASI